MRRGASPRGMPCSRFGTVTAKWKRNIGTRSDNRLGCAVRRASTVARLLKRASADKCIGVYSQCMSLTMCLLSCWYPAAIYHVTARMWLVIHVPASQHEPREIRNNDDDDARDAVHTYISCCTPLYIRDAVVGVGVKPAGVSWGVDAGRATVGRPATTGGHSSPARVRARGRGWVGEYTVML